MVNKYIFSVKNFLKLKKLIQSHKIPRRASGSGTVKIPVLYLIAHKSDGLTTPCTNRLIYC